MTDDMTDKFNKLTGANLTGPLTPEQRWAELKALMESLPNWMEKLADPITGTVFPSITEVAAAITAIRSQLDAKFDDLTEFCDCCGEICWKTQMEECIECNDSFCDNGCIDTHSCDVPADNGPVIGPMDETSDE